jgi:hypothetical protein
MTWTKKKLRRFLEQHEIMTEDNKGYRQKKRFFV